MTFNVIFYPDSDKIKADSFSELDKIADALKERSNIIVEIIGHTNDTNNPVPELALSKKRAEMVRNYLIKKRIDPEQDESRWLRQSIHEKVDDR